MFSWYAQKEIKIYTDKKKHIKQTQNAGPV